MKPLVNMRLITNEVHIKNNNLPDGQFSMVPRLSRNIRNIDNEHTAVELTVEIINSDEHPFPIDVRATMTGVFEVSTLPEDTVENFVKIQAIQIILPYIRALITSATAGSLYPPVVLPVIDVRNLFAEEVE